MLSGLKTFVKLHVTHPQMAPDFLHNGILLDAHGFGEMIRKHRSILTIQTQVPSENKLSWLLRLFFGREG